MRRFGSLTFAKRWLVCRAKGNVPNVGRLTAFLSCGSAKKLNLFSFIVISLFILKPFSLSLSLSLSFLRLVGNVRGYDKWRIAWYLVVNSAKACAGNEASIMFPNPPFVIAIVMRSAFFGHEV